MNPCKHEKCVIVEINQYGGTFNPETMVVTQEKNLICSDTTIICDNCGEGFDNDGLVMQGGLSE